MKGAHVSGAARPFSGALSRHTRLSYRHARTCSGHLPPPLPPADRMDTRNKSGYDGEGRSDMTQGAFGHDGAGAELASMQFPKGL